MAWIQKTLTLKRRRGCHLITSEIEKVQEIRNFRIGMANIFRTFFIWQLVQHTSASLTLNENYDSDVRADMEMMLNRIAPENAPYTHTLEG